MRDYTSISLRSNTSHKLFSQYFSPLVGDSVHTRITGTWQVRATEGGSGCSRSHNNFAVTIHRHKPRLCSDHVTGRPSTDRKWLYLGILKEEALNC